MKTNLKTVGKQSALKNENVVKSFHFIPVGKNQLSKFL